MPGGKLVAIVFSLSINCIKLSLGLTNKVKVKREKLCINKCCRNL